KELLVQQLQEERAQHIFTSWKKHKKTRTIAFCSSIDQAIFLSDYFETQGIQAISLTSRSVNISRSEAIRKLESKEIDIIFTVDLFNEGVDIPSVDTLLFVRPTESLVVFTQQIGRGLRLHNGKSHCVIIDLIGNYRHADVKLSVFNSHDISIDLLNDFTNLPHDFDLELETEVIDLLKEMKRKRSPRRERVMMSYYRVKDELGRRPTYYEMHLNGSVSSRDFRQLHGSYFGFLYAIGEL